MDKIFNDILGELFYEKEFEWFEGNVNWKGSTVSILLYADDMDEKTLDELIATATEIVKNQEKWNSSVKKYAAEKLTELANDWAECDYDEETDEEIEPPEITEEEFMERIDLGSISVRNDGEFIFWFDDDDMFARHTVTVYGDMKNGFSSADIEG